MYRLLSHERTKMELTSLQATGMNQDGIDVVSTRQGDSKTRMHGKECYCCLGVLLSRNSLWCYTPEKQPRRGRHQDHSPRIWCCFSWCNWNYHPFTRYRCFCPVLKISAAMSGLLLEEDRDTKWLIWNVWYRPLVVRKLPRYPAFMFWVVLTLQAALLEKERPLDGRSLWQTMKRISLP